MSLKIWMPLDGTLDNFGTANVSITNNGATVNTSGITGSCYAFDGTQKITLKGSDLTKVFSSSSAPFSFTVWIYLNEDETDRVIIFGSYNSNPFVNWELTASCTPRLCAGGTSNYTTKSNATVVPKTTWTHLAVTYDGTNTTFYQNGEKLSSSSGVNTITSLTSDTFYLGADTRTGVTMLKGRMNDFRMYDHCLSSAEVREISRGLVLHYKLDSIGNGENLIPSNSEKTITLGEGVTNAFSGYWYLRTDVKANGLLYAGAPVVVSYDYEKVNVTATSPYGYSQFNGSSMSPYTTSNYSANTGHISESFRISSDQAEYASSFRLRIRFYGNAGDSIIIRNVHMFFGDLGTLSRVVDSSGYNRHGNVNGSLYCGTNSARYVQSTRFDGTNYITSTALPSTTTTLSCWVKTSLSASTSQIIVGDSASQLGISFQNNCVIGVFGSTRSTGSACTLGDSYVENGWNHIVVVKTSTDGKRNIYCNGVKLASAANNYWTAATGLHIGRRNSPTLSPYPFQGELADLRAYATALSAADILNLYQAGMKVANRGDMHAYMYEEAGGKELIAGTLLTSAYNNHTNPTTYYQDGDIVLTGKVSVSSVYIPVSPSGKTYYYDIEVSTDADNVFYIGFERYDAEKTTRSNNATVFLTGLSGTKAVRTHQRYFGTVDLSTDGVNPCASITLRILNDWSSPSNRVATVHKVSLREVSTLQKQSIHKNGVFLTDELNENAKAAFHKNGMTESVHFIEM